MKTLSLNLIRITFILFFSSAVSNPVKAQAGPIKPDSVSVLYGGAQDEHLVFYVQVTNDAKEQLRFLVRDENKNVLFEENFSGPSFKKKVLLEKAELNNVRFEVVGKNYNYSRQFAISTRTIEEVTVKEAR